MGLPPHAIPLNGEVSFVMVADPRGRQDLAANVQMLPHALQVDQLVPDAGKSSQSVLVGLRVHALIAVCADVLSVQMCCLVLLPLH